MLKIFNLPIFLKQKLITHKLYKIGLHCGSNKKKVWKVQCCYVKFEYSFKKS